MKRLYTFYCWLCDCAWTEICTEELPQRKCEYCNRAYSHEDVVSQDEIIDL